VAIISSSDLKTHLNISDSTDDTSIGVAVNAANAAVVNWCGRTFDTTTTASASARVYRPKTPVLVITDDFHTTTALVVKTGDEGTYDTTLTLNADFIVEPLNGLEDGQSVPYRRIVATSWLFETWTVHAPVQVTAAWGWSSVPDAVKEATLIKAARIFKRRTSPEGVAGGFQDFGAIRISNREDPDVAMLLTPYRRSESALLT
jgi:hypothetical protein